MDTALWIGDWLVDPSTASVARDGEVTRLELRTIRLLLRLAEQPGAVVSNEDLLDYAWPATKVSPDSLYQAVASLRRLFEDDSKHPRYIETVPRQGYRLVASVKAVVPGDVAPPVDTAPSSWRLRLGMVLLLVALAAAGAWAVLRPAGMATHAVAVLPFLDLSSEAMDKEVFADGITEELINRLSGMPGLCVPAPTASFALKGKNLPVDAIARSLQVDYLLDGSIRSSGAVLRVSVRLLRADGFVMWSASYDRTETDLLGIQDDVAAHVAGAIEGVVNHGAGGATP
jgi:TolB-like protein/DNA-binding winged helix-turn-helix (wHTH) protein